MIANVSVYEFQSKKCHFTWEVCNFFSLAENGQNGGPVLTQIFLALVEFGGPNNNLPLDTINDSGPLMLSPSVLSEVGGIVRRFELLSKAFQQ